MKFRLAALAALLIAPVTAFSHGELFFPKVFSAAELRTSGFVLMNPEQVPANVTLYFLSTVGGAVLGSAPVTVPPGGQVAKLGSELFPNAVGTGWVYAQNDTVKEMQAFWLAYNAEVTSLDGSEASTFETIGLDQLIPLVAGQTELNIINPNLVIVPATIRLFGSNGQLGATATRTLFPAGAMQTQVSDLFPSVDMTQARYVRVTASSALSSTAVVKGYLVPLESLVVNGISPTSKELNFSHVISGTIGNASYTTVLSVANPAASAQTVTIVFNPDTGSPIMTTRTLEGGASLRETAQGLFGLPAGFQSGWVKISGTDTVIGFACYADTVAGGLSGVPSGTAQKRLFFTHIADGAPEWQTGLALLNATSAPATIDVYALNPSGTSLGSAKITLDPGKRTAKVLHELVPQTLGINGGFVFISSDVEVQGIELFYTQDLKVLSNVAPGRHLGATYTPPLP